MLLSLDPLVVYVHLIGTTRFASEQYQGLNSNTIMNRRQYLTNTKINVGSRNIVGTLEDGISMIISLSEQLNNLARKPVLLEGEIAHLSEEERY